ncbi:MAG: ABC transporter permease [Opitutaceae bacterium]|nr:ABC transporter permease [Opitutaceae bacterium]
MPWPLYLALKQLFPTGRRFPFFTFMSGLGVAVGVALLHVATSIMGGFGHEIRRMIVDTQGEIQVVSRANIQNPAEIMAQVRAIEGVAGVTPVVRGVVMVMHRNVPAYPMIQGVDLATVGEVFHLQRYLVRGSLDDLDDDSVILSTKLAIELGASVGSQLEVYTPLIIDRMGRDEVLLPRVVRVAGLLQIGHDQLDRSTIITTLRTMQELYGSGDSVQALNVRLAPGVDEFEMVRKINPVLPWEMRAQTWFETNADFQSIVKFEKYMVFFLLTFIVIVAALSIMSSLLISVVRKTREIGLVGALGARGLHVAVCFCTQGFVLGLVGTGLGLALGQAVLHFRADIVRVVAGLTVGEDVFQQFYQFVDLPSHTLASDVVIIAIGSVLASTLAGVLPAWRAARLKPVEALRHE